MYSRVTPFLLFATCILSCLGLTCHIGKFTLVAYLENLPLCQALIEKELKCGVAPIHPPLGGHTILSKVDWTRQGPWLDSVCRLQRSQARSSTCTKTEGQAME